MPALASTIAGANSLKDRRYYGKQNVVCRMIFTTAHPAIFISFEQIFREIHWEWRMQVTEKHWRCGGVYYSSSR